MNEEARSVLLKAVLIIIFSGGLAIGTDLARPGGIPLVTDVPYEIYAPCKDSEVVAEAARAAELASGSAAGMIYVDARPKDVFALGHVEGAVNVPYSVLFGAEEKDVGRLKKIIADTAAKIVIVYGVYADRAAPDNEIELGKLLAEQLVEAGIEGVRHVEGGVEALNKAGLPTVQGDGD